MYGLSQNITRDNLDENTCLVLGFFEDAALPAFTKPWNLEHDCKKLTARGDSLWHFHHEHAILLLHCGEQAAFRSTHIAKLCQTAYSALKQQKINAVTVCIPKPHNTTPNQHVEHMLLSFDGAAYKPPYLKSAPEKQAYALESVQFYLEGATHDAIEAATATAAGVTWARTLANLPANYCTPSHMASEAVAFAKTHDSLSTRVLEREDMKALGMGAFLAISQGSPEPPKLIEIQYRGAGDAAPVVLVGKGVTFDSGGISLKPPAGMHEMKYDMAGAASVLGAVKACALMKLPINLVGLLACTENMPNGDATKPGDVVTSMLGKTIEITNTDAEGRMVLADTLTYAEQFKPRFVLDIATLTGAILIALGRWASGFMTEDEDLANTLEQAALESNDPVWRMPLDESFQSALESPVADMINASLDREAGSVTAACFLSHFTKKFRWAHLDIAGTAWNSGKKHDATGRPVPLLMAVLREAARAR
jgi:leucyl aminopeptidase